MSVEPFPLVEVAGAPYPRGVAYGRQAADRVRKGIQIYGRRLGSMGLAGADIRALVRSYLPTIEAFDAAYLEEMRGIAAGAGVDFEMVALLNARTEILQLGRRGRRADVGTMAAAADGEPVEGCTGAVILPAATRDGVLIHGQNWDWKAECVDTAVVLKVRRDDGPDFLTFTEAGGLARSGFNARGIAITANYLESDRDYQQVGVPLALIRRKVLESEHLALAIRAVACTAKSASNNMIVSHAGGVAIDFECAPDEAFLLHPERGLLVHANHWVSPVALAKLRDTGLASTPDSVYRDVRVRQALEPAIGALTRDHLRAALFDDFATPWSVCRPRRLSVEGEPTATVAMILMEPARGLMEVAPLPAVNREFTTYRLGSGLPSFVSPRGTVNTESLTPGGG